MPVGIGIGAGGAPPNTGSITVGTTPTKILPKNSYRVGAVLINTTGVTIFVGNSTVTTSGALMGFPILPNGTFTVENRNDLYGVVITGTAVINYWEESNP